MSDEVGPGPIAGRPVWKRRRSAPERVGGGRRLDKLGAMRAFVEIVDRGSLTAAGKALDKSLPTMVRVLATLEDELGVRLLRRTTRRLALTDEGRGYVERCRRIFADIDEAERAAGSGHVEPRGEIRVTAPVAFGHWYVAPLMTRFAARFEAVRVELLLLDRVVNLLEEGIDLAVRIGTLPDSTLFATTVGQMRHVVVASPALLERVGVPEHPDDLASRPCVRFRGLTIGTTWRFIESGRERRVTVGGPFACNHAPAAVEACAAGLGFGSFLAYQAEPWVRDGRLCVVLEEFEPTPLPVNLVYADAQLMSARLRALVDWMKDGLRGRPELA